MARRGRTSSLNLWKPFGGSRGAGAPASRSHHHRPWLIPLVATVAVLVVLVGAGLAVALLQAGGHQPKIASAGGAPAPKASLAASDGVPTTATADATASALASGAIDIEVPSVVGKPLLTAETILEVAGLVTATRVADSVAAGVPENQVVDQNPAPGTRLQAGDTVTLTYNPKPGAGTAIAQPVVAIDPGHQAKADLTLEPIGPGSPERKEKVKGGATGIATGVPEYERVLALSLKLRDKLQARGVRVVMVRTTSDVNIANSRRAIIGNEVGAALAVRIHLDSSAQSSLRGVSTLFPSGNAWVKPIEPESRRAAGLIQAAVVKATGAADRGLFPRGDLSGFNYSKVPTVLVECGFLSNAADDRLLEKPEYQDRLASGLAAGVLSFLGK